MKNKAPRLMLLGVLVILTTCRQRVPPSSSAAAPPPRLPAPPLSAPVNPNPQLPTPRPNGSCAIQGELPDPVCTPGVISPLVTQSNIQQTICVSGYTTRIRQQYAPESYTSALKRLQIGEYGYQDTAPGSYEEDHLISLELGGHPNDPRNLWPEPGASPNPKDQVEGLLHSRVCSGAMTLEEAQRTIAANWKSVH